MIAFTKEWKTFLHKQKLRDSVTSTPALKEMPNNFFKGWK